MLLWRYGRQTETPAGADRCRAADIARVGEPAQDRAGPGPAGAHRADVRGREDQRRGGRRAGDHPGDGRQVARPVHQAAVRRAERRAPARRAAHDHRRADRGGGGADPGGGARGSHALVQAGTGQAGRALADHDPPDLAGLRAQTLAGGGVQGLHRPVPDRQGRDVVGLYLAPPANAAVFSVDEKPQIQALERTARCCR